MRTYAYFPFPMAITSEPDALRAAAEEPTWAVLSIRDSGMDPLPFETTAPQLHLSFDDLQQMPNPWALMAGDLPPGRREARQIVDFARLCAETQVPGLLIHCAAGISRSSAACLGVAMTLLQNSRTALYELQHSVDRSYEREWRGDLIVHPNRRLVALLDLELECGGTLVRSMLDEYRTRAGQDAAVMSEFALRDALRE